MKLSIPRWALPRGELLIIATGGHGEPRAALGRMAENNHPIELTQGDVVLFFLAPDSRAMKSPIGKIQNQAGRSRNPDG